MDDILEDLKKIRKVFNLKYSKQAVSNEYKKLYKKFHPSQINYRLILIMDMLKNNGICFEIDPERSSFDGEGMIEDYNHLLKNISKLVSPYYHDFEFNIKLHPITQIISKFRNRFPPFNLRLHGRSIAYFVLPLPMGGVAYFKLSANGKTIEEKLKRKTDYLPYEFYHIINKLMKVINSPYRLVTFYGEYIIFTTKEKFIFLYKIIESFETNKNAMSNQEIENIFNSYTIG